MKGSSAIRTLATLDGLPPQTVSDLEPTTKVFEFRISRYYAGLIDWSNPDDPLRQIVLPDRSELDSDLMMDASDEVASTHVHGLQHKYRPTALLLVNDVCAAYCRFCFRKRFTLATSRDGHLRPALDQDAYEKETTFDPREGVAYIRAHPEITNVLITGGDPLMLSVRNLEGIIKQLRSVPHVKTIRVGTKVPAFDPERLHDEMLAMLAAYSSRDGRVYLMMHFNHERELTPVACARLEKVVAAGLPMCNQTPLLKGVNDSATQLVALNSRLADSGVTPYYVFHCRPTRGNDRFMMSLQEGLRIVNEARTQLSGLAKRFHYVGSHATGKIEIVGKADDRLIMRYHEAKAPEDENQLLTWPIDREAFWFDDVVRANRSTEPAIA